MDGVSFGRFVFHIEDGDVSILSEDFGERGIRIVCGDGWLGRCSDVFDLQPGGIIDQLVSPQIHEKIEMLEKVSTDDWGFHIGDDKYPQECSSQTKIDGDAFGTVGLNWGTVCGEKLFGGCWLEAFLWCGWYDRDVSAGVEVPVRRFEVVDMDSLDVRGLVQFAGVLVRGRFARCCGVDDGGTWSYLSLGREYTSIFPSKKMHLALGLSLLFFSHFRI